VPALNTSSQEGTMRAVVFEQHGGPEVLHLAERPTPVPRADEVLVEVRACALNHLDVWTRRGIPGIDVPLPHILGNDIAGVVAAVGDLVTSVAVGDRVLLAPGVCCGACAQCLGGDDNMCPKYDILGYRRDGGYAEYLTAPARNAHPIPGGLSYAQAASVPLTFLTAWHMLVARARVKPGEDVLVLAAGSGVGSAAIQVAKLFGARVIATASTEAKREAARDLGADDVVDYATEARFDKVVKRLTGGKGVEVVVEHVGAATWSSSMSSLATNGRIVTCGATTGFEARIDLRHLFYRHLAVFGSFMGRHDELVALLPFFEDGRLRPVVDRVLPLAHAADAHRLIEDRAQFGKVVLEVTAE
jgi:NADPH:quinone reductase-like Zn-dependent oxidoreductase